MHACMHTYIHTYIYTYFSMCVSHVNALFWESTGNLLGGFCCFPFLSPRSRSKCCFAMFASDPTPQSATNQTGCGWCNIAIYNCILQCLEMIYLLLPSNNPCWLSFYPINYPWLKSYFPFYPHYIPVQHHGDLRWRHVWLWSRRPRMAGNLVLCSFFGRGPWKSCLVY